MIVGRLRNLSCFCGLLLSFAAFSGLGHAAEPAVVTVAPERFAAIAQIVQREIGAGHIPGAVIVAGGPGGVFYRHAFGDRLISVDQPLRADDIFDLASLTKVVATTTAIMQLAEKGQLSLDDYVAKYWPAFGANGKEHITIKQLLTHNSGLRPDLDLRQSWQGPQAALARTEQERPVAVPGTRFQYSDINFIALGELVRRLSGKSLETYAAENIFRPLGMSDTAFNPDVSKLNRIVPTDVQDGMLRQGKVQDPTAYRMGGVAGHAGLFSTADDLSRFAQMMLGEGSRGGKSILSPASVKSMSSGFALPGGFRRGLGWDIASDYDGGMAMAFGPASYGHTGYTGTSLWIDTQTKTYLIILTSRLYPNDRGDVRPLRQELAEAVAEVSRAPKLMTGIDALENEDFAPLKGLRVAVLTNQTGRDAQGKRTIDALAEARGLKLTAIFSPEHGIDGDQNSKVASSTDKSTGLPVFSLYGRTLRPTADMLADVDAVVVDLQDAGVRFYTYATTVAYVMEEAAKRGIKVFVLDRPNPIGTAGAAGPILDPALESFTGYFPLPVQHGMTLGELVSLFNAEKKIGANLTIVPMRGYQRRSWYDDSGLPWIAPSPNLRSVDEAILYPGLGLIEGANLSVGRGTATPFEIIGAPWIDGAKLAEMLNSRAIPGTRFEAAAFTPAEDRYAGQPCSGVRITLTDRDTLNAPRLGIEIASALMRLHPGKFELSRIVGGVGSSQAVSALERGEDPQSIVAGWAEQLLAFEALQAKYRLYP